MEQIKEKLKFNERSNILNVVGIISGKGGVGKSFVTSMLALDLTKKGYKVGILDADISGPSIPHIFNVKDKAYGDNNAIYPYIVKQNGISIVSSAMLIEQEEDPLIWRGPLISELIKQFYTTVNWGELDYLLIDFPPGTSDITMTAFEELPLNQLIIVTTPQEMVSKIVMKAVNMAKLMNVNILGVVENMSYFKKKDSGEKIQMFFNRSADSISARFNLPTLGQIPFDPTIARMIDEGQFNEIDTTEFNNISSIIIEKGNIFYE